MPTPPKPNAAQTEEIQRLALMAKIEPLFRNVEAMEQRLKQKGRDPLQDKHYRRSAAALSRSVQYARDKGWMRQKDSTNN